MSRRNDWRTSDGHVDDSSTSRQASPRGNAVGRRAVRCNARTL